MSTYAPPDTDRSNGHHHETEDELALRLFDNLLSDSPTYAYDLAMAGKYERQLSRIEEARKIGIEPARNVVEAIKARPTSELALLLANRQATSAARDDSPTIPPLPDSVQFKQRLLPQFSNDWFKEWDSSELRKVSPFLAEYTGYSHNVSPEGFVDFHITSGLWVLSTIAARRIFVPLAKRMYTPLAAALVARTSLFAKTTTAQAGINVLKRAGLGWLLGDDETTPQKLLFDMAGHIPTNYADMDFDRQMAVDRRLGMSGQLGWYYDEFNQLIDAMTRPGPMAEFAGLLRKLDDCPDEYKYSTKGGGQEVIERPYLALLANTTPANLRKHASRGAEFWNDGFWARFAFITPPPDAWKTETMDLGEVEIPACLTNALKEWNTRLGVPNCHIEEIEDENGKKTGRHKVVRDPLPSNMVMIDQEAYQAYKRYREALRTMISKSDNQDLDGSYVRLSDKALRTAALIASLEHYDRIDLSIWALAQEIAEMFRRNLHELYNQVSSEQDDSPYDDKLLGYLKTVSTPVTVRDILQRGPRDIRRLKTEGIRTLLINLALSGEVDCKKEGKKEIYSLKCSQL